MLLYRAHVIIGDLDEAAGNKVLSEIKKISGHDK